jgi:hypothetical protein
MADQPLILEDCITDRGFGQGVLHVDAIVILRDIEPYLDSIARSLATIAESMEAVSVLGSVQIERDSNIRIEPS